MKICKTLAYFYYIWYNFLCRDPLRAIIFTYDRRIDKGEIDMNIIDRITKSQIRTDLPEFRVGDTVRVNVRIIEGKNERIQAFEGIVMAIQGGGVSKTFTVRKISGGVGVERIFPFNSPKIESLSVVRRGKVRRAKLNYLRTLKGQPKIKEKM